MITIFANDFSSWREASRKLLQEKIHPNEIFWNNGVAQTSLFYENKVINANSERINITKEFLKLAENICHHRDPERFNYLYQMAFRLVYENKYLLQISSDPLTNILELMTKSIIRDVHKTKAFVRFRKTFDDGGKENFIAWYKPDHYSLKLSAPFFMRRFSTMKWTILTPDESVHFDKSLLHFGPGAKVTDAPDEDIVEELWREFYRSIFNPARIKIKAMKREMPVRFWETLPEARIIKEILDDAPNRVKNMIAHSEGYNFSANDFIPSSSNMIELKDASKRCEGCPLYQKATQTVFGVGPSDARLVLVGEQPSSEEDLSGMPFVGPAGKILNDALQEAGINRDSVYLTNAVKHFKFNHYNGRRLHQTPNMQDIINCRPWLERELQTVQPELIVCLGLTAAKSLLSAKFKSDERGQFIKKGAFIYLVTYHPSAVLRSENSDEIFASLVQNLLQARSYLKF